MIITYEYILVKIELYKKILFYIYKYKQDKKIHICEINEHHIPELINNSRRESYHP